MSTTPPEPENAAPPALVKPEQAHEPTPAADQNNASLAAARRTLSSSLLSRLFPRSCKTDESSTIATGSGKHTETVATPDSSCPAGREGTNLYYINNPNSKHTMATMIPPAKLPALGVRAMPANQPHEFDISDIRQVTSFLTGHGDLPNSKRGRGTSLERTQKEKREPDFSEPVFSINPGDTGTINTPAPKNTTSSITSSNNPLVDGVRANYRSWRDITPSIAAGRAWSVDKGASGEVPEGQVEKSIAEALAGIEPNSRSRKASQSFFKEGLPIEKPKRREPRDSGRLKDKLPRMKDLAPSDNGCSDESESMRSPDLSTDGQSPSNIELPSKALDSVGHTGENDSQLKSLQPHVDERLDSSPTQYLDDLTKEHNLSPVPTKAFSSRSPPVSISERDQSSNISQDAHDAETAKADEGENTTVTKEEDEESGEEQISSALFVPHKTPHDSVGHEMLKLIDQDQSGSQSQRCTPAESENWLSGHKVAHDGETLGKAVPHDSLGVVGDYTQEQEHDNYPADALQSPDFPNDTASEAGYSTRDDESSFTDDAETTPTGSTSGRHYMSQNQKDHLHHHQQVAKAPLEAIELIPYRHQVGGHTTMWRFSRRAVCKQLNNRENEFYERIEQHHPKLLKFMPKYIGVLNVTFEKQLKRKVSPKENGAIPEGDAVSPGLSRHSSGYALKDATERPKAVNGDDRRGNPPRLVSQSIGSGQAPTPTVTFADNRHIIPKSFLQPSLQTQEAVRMYLSESATMTALSGRRSSQSQPLPPNNDFTYRPSLSDKHAASWGATTVNKKLRNEVFGEAFLRQSPFQHHRQSMHQHRSLAHRPGQPSALSQLRTSSSESNLIAAQQDRGSLTGNNDFNKDSVQNGGAEHNIRMPSTSDSSVVASPLPKPSQVGKMHISNSDELKSEDKTATRAGVPESPANSYRTNSKRRYSSDSLLRKPEDDIGDQENFKHLEAPSDAGYRSNDRVVVSQVDPEVMDTGNASSSRASESQKIMLHPTVEASDPPKSPGGSEAVRSVLPHDDVPVNEILPVPRPVNPKEAQTQRDKRVEFFLLLEDLTAGMKRPCIMDLKMGTRQYGVDANEKKRNSQRRKCAETTSKELGVRVCGLQVWDVATQSYFFQDKYFGRKLKAGREFKDALQRFLFNGIDYVSILRHIPTILYKLSELEVLIKDLQGYRFYAASLLMFYDGEVGDERNIADTSATLKEFQIKRYEIDFKIADFANCVTAENGPTPVRQRACPPQHPEEPDRGFLRGLRSLRRYFVDIQKEVMEIEKKKGVNMEDGKNNVTNGYGLTTDPFDEDLGEISY